MSNLIASTVDIKSTYAFGNISSLGEGVDLLTKPAFSIATVAVTFYFIFAAYKLISSGGEKEALANAQKMITHAIIGFIILMSAFLILQFITGSLFSPTGSGTGFNLRLIK